MSQQQGSLYIVATPIGNLGDITHRAIEVLSAVDVIAAEDTRHSQRLLGHYGIQTPLLSLHEHNEQSRAAALLVRLQQGQNVALISDAGTPLVSDPGYRLVSLLAKEGINVLPIPGPCAAIAALVASGLATDRFVFEGFLAAKGAPRKQRLLELADEKRTVILYESVHRIVKLLQLLNDSWGSQRSVAVARELTKRFETVQRGTAEQVLEHFNAHPEQCKGEFVVILEGVQGEDVDAQAKERRRLLDILLKQVPLKQAVMIAMEITGCKRKPLYELALTIKGDDSEKTTV